MNFINFMNFMNFKLIIINFFIVSIFPLFEDFQLEILSKSRKPFLRNRLCLGEARLDFVKFNFIKISLEAGG